MGVALLSTLALVAQTSTSTPAERADERAEEIVVTAARGSRRRSEAPVATEVISSKEIEASGSQNMSQLLEQHPGVELERTTRGTTIRLQGLDSESVLLLIDGERATGKVGGGVDLSRINLENVAKVEIVKGASSALYGADAIGGVINIITKEPRHPLEADLRAMYGRAFQSCEAGCLNAVDLTGGAGMRQGALSLRVDGGFHRADGYDLDPADQNTSGADSSGGEIGGRAQLRLSSDTTIGLRAGFERLDLTAVDAVLGSSGIFDRQQRSDVISAAIKAQHELDPTSRLKASGSFSQFRLQIVLDQRGDTALDSVSDDRQTTGQLTLQYERTIFEQHELTFGVEGLVERQDVEYVGEPRDRFRGAVYLQDEWTHEWEGRRVTLVPGLRADGDTQFGGAVSPKVALRYDPSPDVRFRASYGYGFRAPTFEELYLSFINAGSGYRISGCEVPTGEEAAPSCGPELALSFHTGLELDLIRGVTLSTDGFLHEIDNLLATQRREVPGQLTEFRYTNFSSAQTRGLEVQLSLRPLDLAGVQGLTLGVELGYTFTDTIDRENDRALEGRAKHRGTLRLLFSAYDAGLDASIRASFVGPRPYYQRDPPVEADGYVSLGFQIAKSLGEELSLFVGADNLFDAGDQEFLPIPPRRFYAGVAGRLRVEEDEEDVP